MFQRQPSYGNFMTYSHTENKKNDVKSRHASIKKILAAMPAASTRLRLNPYEKQLVELPAIIYHKQTKQLLSKAIFNTPEEKTIFVAKRVARMLWTNFCVQGHDTPMLRHLYSALRAEYGNDLQFQYPSTNIDFVITRKMGNHIKPVSRAEQITLINMAWQISQDVVHKYTH